MKKTSPGSSSSDAQPAPASPFMPGTAFPGIPFDMSSMAGLLNVYYELKHFNLIMIISEITCNQIIRMNPVCGFLINGDLQDPSIKELAEQISKDPSFNKMAEQLQQTFHGGDHGVPQFDTQQYFSTMQQVMQNPQFMSMAESLGNAMMQVLLLLLLL